MILNGTVIGQSSGRSAGTAVYSDVACYAGANQSDGKYVYILKFKTPDFKGVFEKLNLSLYIKSNYSKTITLRYALATSDANRNSYRNTTAAVTEEYQLESGTFPFDGISTSAYNTITMSLNSAVKANTEYYLYLWGYNNTSCLCTVGNISYHSIEVEYTAQTYIDSVSAVTLGGAVAVKFTPPSASFAYKLKFSIGSWSSTTGVISPKTTAQYTHTQTIPLEVANQITGSPPSGTMTVTLYSYSDSTASTQVGTEDSKTFTATVPDNEYTKPAVSMTLSLVNTLSAPFNAFYIQNLTKVSASISATGEYGASISAYQLVVGRNTIGSPYVSGYLTQIGNVDVTAEATDSRGYVGQTQQTIYVIPYGKPSIVPASDETKVICARCDADGNLTDSGTYLKIKAKRSYSPVISDGEQYNFCQIRYRCNGGSWVTILAGDDAGDEIDIQIPNVVTSTTTAYTIEVGVIDDLGYSASETIIVPSDQVEFHLREGGNGAAFGEYAQEANVLAVAENWELKAKGNASVGGDLKLGNDPKEADHAVKLGSLLDLIYPVGSIYMSVNNVSPSAFLGGTWERIKDKFLLSSGDTYGAGSTGGEATHTLTASEMPSHTHTFTGTAASHDHATFQRNPNASTSPTYQYMVDTQATGDTVNGWGVGMSAYTGRKQMRTTTASLRPAGTNANTGGGSAHNNMPPYLAVYVWQRTK